MMNAHVICCTIRCSWVFHTYFLWCVCVRVCVCVCVCVCVVYVASCVEMSFFFFPLLDIVVVSVLCFC
jgi:hypothetical protein